MSTRREGEPREEEVVVVDAANRVVGAAPRSQVLAQGLVYRAAYILVFNSRGELYVQKRTPTKDLYPGWYDAAAGGIVLAGERYAACARRELAEELGIRGVPLVRRFDLYFEEGGNRAWGRAYTCVYDGPLRLQPEEVAHGLFAPVGDVLGGRFAPLTPDTRGVLERHASPPGRG